MFKFLRKIADSFAKMSTAKKSAAAVMSLSLILAGYFFFSWMTRTEYSPLFTNMEAESAGEVVAKLEEMGIPHRLADKGTTILVPSERVYDLRIKLASEGVFSESGVGFELFDESRLGTTDFERHLNYLRALQEELRRTIVQLEAVEQARVHLVMPEPSVFVEDEGVASASVALKLKPMSTLEPEQVKGIVQLVANSVEKLQPENVTIIDMNGRVLTDYLFDQMGTSGTFSLKQMELKREFERNLERRIQQLLERMYGSGKVVAMVTADLDFNQKEVSKIEWGDEGVIRSEQLIREEASSSTDQASPVGEENRDYQELVADESTGENESITRYPSLDQGSNSSSSRTESITNYEINKTEERIVYAPGRLKSLSTAVTVDGQLSQDKVESIKKIIAAAIGYNPERGDQITVMGMEFNKNELKELEAQMAAAAAEQKRSEKLDAWLSWGYKILLAILFFVLVIVLIRNISSALKSTGSSISKPTPVSQVEEEIKEKQKPKEEHVVKQEKAQKIAGQKPEEAVQIIKTWLAED